MGTPGGGGTELALGVFGSEGSFTEEAGESWAEREGVAARLVPEPDLERLFARLAGGELDLVCLPVANSVGGLVRATFETLGRHAFRPVGQVSVPVRHALVARPGVEPATLQAVASHPQAFVQCERFLARTLPGAALVERGDTASAARDLARGELSDTTAVIASRRASLRFGLRVLAEDIQDVRDNRTVFLVLGRAQEGGSRGDGSGGSRG